MAGRKEVSVLPGPARPSPIGSDPAPGSVDFLDRFASHRRSPCRVFVGRVRDHAVHSLARCGRVDGDCETDVRSLGACALSTIPTLVLSILSTSQAIAAWPNNPNTNLPICTAASGQDFPEAVSDGEGGSVVCWQDGRLGYPSRVYAQRVSAAGENLWATDGVTLSTSVGQMSYPILAGDGASGAFVVWSESRDEDFTDIYAQHVDGGGNLEWGPTGTLVCAAAMGQFATSIIPDGSGGAIVSWLDGRDDQFAVYVQKVAASGERLWGNGIALSSASLGGAYFIGMIADGSGGAILTWEDSRNYFWDIFVQRIDTEGNILWTPHGVQLTSDFESQASPWIVSDGGDGAIVVWEDARDDRMDLYAQRVDGTGTPQWIDEGVPVCTAEGTQNDVRLISDGEGGAIITWDDRRPGANGQDVYAQRIDASGASLWTMDGVPVCDATEDQYHPSPVSDGAGGAIIWWIDQRSPSGTYAQRLNTAGTRMWGSVGIPVSFAYNGYAVRGTSDGLSGAILVWSQGPGESADIFGQRLSPPVANAGGPYVGVVGTAVSFSGSGSTDPGDDALAYLWDCGDGTLATGINPTHVYMSDNTFAVTLTVSDGVIANVDTTMAAIYVSTPTLVSLVNAHATANHVRLEWYTGDRYLMPTVYRRTINDSWSARGQTSADGNGAIIYEDSKVLGETRLGYRLGVRESGREVYLGETWVDIPRALALALDGSRPNPSRKDLTIAFSLPDASSAYLEVLDLAGRRIEGRDVGMLGPGNHVLRLAEGRDLAPGVYLLRLAHRGCFLTARAVIVR